MSDLLWVLQLAGDWAKTRIWASLRPHLESSFHYTPEPLILH